MEVDSAIAETKAERTKGGRSFLGMLSLSLMLLLFGGANNYNLDWYITGTRAEACTRSKSWRVLFLVLSMIRVGMNTSNLSLHKVVTVVSRWRKCVSRNPSVWMDLSAAQTPQTATYRNIQITCCACFLLTCLMFACTTSLNGSTTIQRFWNFLSPLSTIISPGDGKCERQKRKWCQLCERLLGGMLIMVVWFFAQMKRKQKNDDTR